MRIWQMAIHAVLFSGSAGLAAADSIYPFIAIGGSKPIHVAEALELAPWEGFKTNMLDAGIGAGAATGSAIGFTPSPICPQRPPCWPPGIPWPCPDSGWSGLSGHQKGKVPAIEMAIDPYFPFPYPL